MMRRCVGTWPRRWLVAVTLLLGAASAFIPDRSFAELSDPVQSLMSVTVPLLGILLIADLRRAPGTGLVASLPAAVLVAAAIGGYGVLVCALMTGGSWRDTPVVILGGVLVQVLAQLVGTGMALLLRSPWLAFPATFLPFVLWLALDDGSARAWLTPYETARHLLSGHMTQQAWLQWLAVFALWGIALNAAGAAAFAARRRDGGGSARGTPAGSLQSGHAGRNEG
ncbi:hypothetical protein [Dactylosporangium sp. NPDC005555]|uniref:hypothetical protein n=1 Tax=Dactylosporangium sp. NPDC005555 TaxID=3154889 RepID=UPI0033A84B9D